MLRDEVQELREGVMVMEKQVKEQTLAIELMHELKKSSKRWFIISIILLIALLVTNIGWLIYESQFEIVTETQTVEQHQEETENSNMSGVIN